ncbi:MAG: TetR/AcrR family transcriptional regulator [Acidobacteria bacterium]|nr:TetR/AcrR family transcriptional regulator [Acidobacteriota bacterium]
MGRPRNFDQDEILGKAVEIFRARGYAGTSLDDLEKGLGLGRQSLYNTFGDKDALYAAALRRYREDGLARFREVLRDPRPVRVVLREFLLAAAQDSREQPDSWGCLVLNAALERSGDAACSKLVAGNNEALVSALAERLARDQASGDLGAHHDPVALAGFLLSVLLGLRIYARTAKDSRAAEGIVRHALAALG